MEQAKRLWLADFLVNTGQNSYNAFDPNEEIWIRILGDDKEENLISRGLYGKRTRP